MKVSPLFIGIDPGDSSGGLAIIARDGSFIDASRLAGTKANPITSVELFERVHGWHSDIGIAYGVLEKVGVMPGQGGASGFKFGISVGRMRMLLAACRIPFEEVTPAKWQKAMKCLTKGDKNVSKIRAQELWPGVDMTHWKADALLMAEHARRLFNERLIG